MTYTTEEVYSFMMELNTILENNNIDVIYV